MNHLTSTTPTPSIDGCPSGPVTVQLPLATIEELDHHARLQHLDRDELLAQLIDAALMNEPPHRPSGADANVRLAQRAQLTRARSRQLAGRAA